jgi:hypothetical protein
MEFVRLDRQGLLRRRAFSVSRIVEIMPSGRAFFEADRIFAADGPGSPQADFENARCRATMPWCLELRAAYGANPQRSTMGGSGSFLVSVATAAVAIVLVLGLINMLRGGSPNRSQNLMRMRVVLQAVAILLILLVLWARGH